MRALRNAAIIALLALVIAVVPGGGNAARAIAAVLSLAFMTVIVLTARELYRQQRLTLMGLTDVQRLTLFGALGAIVLMIAGTDELTDGGVGVLIWIAVIGASIFAIFRVWQESRSSY